MSGGLSEGSSRVGRFLFAIQWTVGRLLRWDGQDHGLGAGAPTLRDQLPADLRDGPSGPKFGPFTTLYLTDDDWAAEIANRAVHGLLHLGWVPDGAGGYHGQMAVYAKPNGRLGTLYIVVINPFRQLLVYPPIVRHRAEMARTWAAARRLRTARTPHRYIRSAADGVPRNVGVRHAGGK